MILPEKPEDDSVLNNLSSHLSGELPNVDRTPQKASEVTPLEVASESPQQQHAPEPQMPPSVLEHTVPEQNVPEHTVPGQTTSDHTPAHIHSEDAMEIDDIIIDLDAEADQTSPMEVDQSASDHSQSQSSSNSQSFTTNNLQIEPIAAPRPRKQPSPPTRFLDSNVLKGVCEDIADKMIKLISSRNDLSHRESYEKQWRRLKERVENVINALSSTCVEAQEQAKQKLQDWLNGINEDLEEVKIMGTWARSSLSITGREPTDFLPQYIHPKDLDLSFLTKVNLKAIAPDLALVQRNKVLEEKNQKLEKDLFKQRLLLLEHKVETDAKLEEARIREENMARSYEQFKAEMQKKQEETNELLRKILENTSKQTNP